jgi:hypothetical protein
VATQFVPDSLANHHSTTAPHRPFPPLSDIPDHAAHYHSSVSGFAASHRAGSYAQFHTSQETHYVSATEPNQLMLFGETVAVYCENHVEHTDTVRTSQETPRVRYRVQPVNAV